MKRIIAILFVPAIVTISALAQNRQPTHRPAAKPATGTSAASVANGKMIYVKYCLSCHQADGGGVQNMNPPLSGSPYVMGDKARIINIVLNGFNKGVEINGQTYTNAMPSFNYLKDKDVADVLTYIRSHFTNKADAVNSADVTSIRSAATTAASRGGKS
jgi:mono/diheme cytochrome c family protein